MSDPPVLELREVAGGVSLGFAPGRPAALRGETGCGKRVLLRLAGLLDDPGEGRVRFRGRDVWGEEREEVAQLRQQYFGYLHPAPFLLPALTVVENIGIPLLRNAGASAEAAAVSAREILELIGLEHAASEAADGLPLYEQLLVSLARALAHSPVVLICDESESCLHPAEHHELLQTIERLRQRLGFAVVASVVPRLELPEGWRVIDLSAGRVTGDSEAPEVAG